MGEEEGRKKGWGVKMKEKRRKFHKREGKKASRLKGRRGEKGGEGRTQDSDLLFTYLVRSSGKAFAHPE